MLLSQPIRSEKTKRDIDEGIKSVPILKMAQKMLRPVPGDRPTSREVQNTLRAAFPKNEVTKTWLKKTMDKLEESVLQVNQIHLNANTKAAADLSR